MPTEKAAVTGACSLLLSHTHFTGMANSVRLFRLDYSKKSQSSRYVDSVDNAVDENSSVFFVRMRWLPSTSLKACGQ